MPDGHDYQVVNDWSRHTGWAHAPAVAYAQYGIVVFAFLALAAYAWAWWRGDARTLVGAGWAGAAGLVAVAVNQLPVQLLQEARPYAVMPGALVLVARSSDPSAPSDHAVVAAAVATGLLLIHRRLGLLAWALALLMGFDRVYVGAHYPTDVLLGLLEGTAVALAGWYVARPVLDRVRQRLTRTPLAALVQRPGHVVAADVADPTPRRPSVGDG